MCFRGDSDGNIVPIIFNTDLLTKTKGLIYKSFIKVKCKFYVFFVDQIEIHVFSSHTPCLIYWAMNSFKVKFKSVYKFMYKKTNINFDFKSYNSHG